VAHNQNECWCRGWGWEGWSTSRQSQVAIAVQGRLARTVLWELIIDVVVARNHRPPPTAHAAKRCRSPRDHTRPCPTLTALTRYRVTYSYVSAPPYEQSANGRFLAVVSIKTLFLDWRLLYVLYNVTAIILTRGGKSGE
jgi:hypothetical protein